MDVDETQRIEDLHQLDQSKQDVNNENVCSTKERHILYIKRSWSMGISRE